MFRSATPATSNLRAHNQHRESTTEEKCGRREKEKEWESGRRERKEWEEKRERERERRRRRNERRSNQEGRMTLRVVKNTLKKITVRVSEGEKEEGEEEV